MLTSKTLQGSIVNAIGSCLRTKQTFEAITRSPESGLTVEAMREMGYRTLVQCQRITMHVTAAPGTAIAPLVVGTTHGKIDGVQQGLIVEGFAEIADGAHVASLPTCCIIIECRDHYDRYPDTGTLELPQ